MTVDYPAMIFPGDKEIIVSGAIVRPRTGPALHPKGSRRMSDALQKRSDFSRSDVTEGMVKYQRIILQVLRRLIVQGSDVIQDLRSDFRFGKFDLVSGLKPQPKILAHSEEPPQT